MGLRRTLMYENGHGNLQSAICNLQLAIGYRLSAIGYFRVSVRF